MADPGEQAAPTPLATLLQLGRRVRAAAELSELRFILVNESHRLTPYRQAALWERNIGVVALSGIASVEGNTPYTQFLQRLFQVMEKADPNRAGAGDGKTARILGPENLSREQATHWSEWLPEQALMIPIPAVGHGFSGGAVLLARPVPWTPAEIALLQEWIDTWAARRGLVQRSSKLKQFVQRLRGASPALVPIGETKGAGKPRQSRLRFLRSVLVAGAIAACTTIPVPLTVLAPGQLVPLSPAIVRAPIDGVIDTVLVRPDQQVTTGEPLIDFDRDALNNRLLVAERALETSRARVRQQAQQGLNDPQSRMQAVLAQGRLEEQQLELEYLRDLSIRTRITAPRSGRVLMDDPLQWQGRPVVTGERILLIADEQDVELEIWLSPGDAVPLPAGTPVVFHLSNDPLKTLSGEVRLVGHEPLRQPEGHYAFRVRARVDASELSDPAVRVGLTGTAKLRAEHVSLGYWLIRRPLATVRRTLGL